MPNPAPEARVRLRLLAGLVLAATVLLEPVVHPAVASAAVSPHTAAVDVTAPVYNGDAPDPDIVRDGSTYYVYTTASAGVHIPVLQSTDLQHWTKAGDALPTLPLWEKPGMTWAPGVIVLNNQFVMYYATERASDGEECISEATSIFPVGPFVDSSTGPLVCQSNLGGSLDPQPFVAPSGTPYLYWKSDGGNGALPIPGNLWVAQLSADGSSVVGASVNILTETQSWETTVENPYMVNVSGTDVLFYSAGEWNSAGYGVGYAVCQSPLGPCTKPTNGPILHSDTDRLGPGGESLVTDGTGNWWMAYAAWNGPSSAYSYAEGDVRTLWIAPVAFSGTTPDIEAGEAPEGYDMVGSDGGVFAFGAASFHGSMGGQHLDAPVVATVADPATGGYWEVAGDGGVFAFDAPFYGSMGGHRLSGFMLGMAATPDGGGYWLVASDGGVFAFGDARYYGSMGGRPLAKPVIGMAVTANGDGYWLVASDGGIFAFGNAIYWGSTGGIALARPVVGMAAMPQGGGYWLVASDGGVFAFGAAQYFGSTGGIALARPVVAIMAGPGAGGYWLVASDGGVFNFGDATYEGSVGGIPLAAPVVGATV